LFYIFCFRHGILRKQGDDDDSSSDWECGLDKLFQRLIITKFNPLKYCKGTVVAMFAQISQKENAAYCFTVMEQNRLGGFNPDGTRTKSNSIMATSPLGGGSNGSASYFGAAGTFWSKSQEFVTLEGYFPFDPLVLPKAKKSITSLYVEWEDVAGDYDSGSEDYDDEDEEAEA